MCSHGQTYRRSTMTGLHRALLYRAGCLLAAASLLPTLILGPLGPGFIVIHEHHEEDFHAHKVDTVPGGLPTSGSGHDHPTDGAVDFEGAQFFLTLNDPPRLPTCVQASAFQPKPALPLVMIATASSGTTAGSPLERGAHARPTGVLRAHSRIAELLQSGHSLLI